MWRLLLLLILGLFIMDNDMSKDPAILFYYQDFLVGTEFMTDEETGIYIRILCHLADKERLTKKQVLSICKASAFTDNIQSKLKIDKNGFYYNQRMLEEKEKRLKFTESRRINAKGGKAYAEHMVGHMENENINENINENEIENVFLHWNNFAKKNGLSEIIKLSVKRKSAILQRLKEPEFKLGNIFNEIQKSDFLKGSNGWKVDFDFVFCSTNNYLKILEGKYRNGIKQSINRGKGAINLDILQQELGQVRKI